MISLTLVLLLVNLIAFTLFLLLFLWLMKKEGWTSKEKSNYYNKLLKVKEEELRIKNKKIKKPRVDFRLKILSFRPRLYAIKVKHLKSTNCPLSKYL